VERGGGCGEGVERGIEEADGRVADEGGLLIGERGEGGPSRRGEAGAGPSAGAGAQVADVVVEVGFRGYAGTLRNVVEALFWASAMPFCQDGMGVLSGLMPPPLKVHAVSDCHWPERPAVTRCVPPTAVT
jgi:hypothetical protein